MVANHVTVTTSDHWITSVTWPLVSVTAETTHMVENVTNVSRDSGTTPPVSGATAMATQPCVIQRLVFVSTARITQVVHPVTFVNMDFTETH
jgi:hypothetical protein